MREELFDKRIMKIGTDMLDKRNVGIYLGPSFLSWQSLSRALKLIAVGLSAISVSMSAQIVSNLGETMAFFRPVGNFHTDGEDFGNSAAIRFTTGNNVGGYTLTSATVPFSETFGSPAPIQVTVNNSGPDIAPLASLGTLSGSNPTDAGNYTFTNAGISLAANTTYYLTFAVPGGPTGSISFYYPNITSSDSETSSDGWTISNTHNFTTNGGGIWQTDSSRALQFSLTATPVPEPHEYAMFVGLGLIGFVAARRRLVSKALA